MDCSTPGFPTPGAWSNPCAIQPSHPLLSPSPPTFNLSQHQDLFQLVSSLHQMAKVLGLQLQAFQWISGLISFRTDWFDLPAVQGILKSLSQYHSSKASILRCSVFFTVQLSHPYMTTGKNTALTRRTFVSTVTSLLFNMLSRFAIALLPRSKRILISWLQSPSAVILEPKKIKSLTVSTVSPSICHEVMGLDAMILVFSECWVLRPLYHSPLLLSSRRSSVPLHFLPYRWCHLHICGYWYFSLQSWFQLVLHPADNSHDVLCK